MTAVTTISQQIWDMKYRYKKPGGEIVDKTIEDSWRRIAHALAEPETDKSAWEKRFYDALEGFKFLPAGRIVAGAGIESCANIEQRLKKLLQEVAEVRQVDVIVA